MTDDHIRPVASVTVDRHVTKSVQKCRFVVHIDEKIDEKNNFIILILNSIKTPNNIHNYFCHVCLRLQLPRIN